MRNFLIDLCCEIMNELCDKGGFADAEQAEIIAMMNVLNSKKEEE